MVRLIECNDEIRNRFNEYYEEFVSKYGENDDINKMYDEINNIKYDDVKRKIKYKGKK